MTVSFTEEQEELRRYAREWLDERAPIEHVRKVSESEEGVDLDQWQELGELGWLGMAVPEEYGGAASGFPAVAVLAEEMGRTLYPSPFLATVVMGATLIEAAGTPDQQRELLPDVVNGRRRLTVAFTEPGGGWATEGFETRVTGEGEAWSVRGVKSYVLDGHTADTVIVAATAADGVALVVVDGDGEGVTRTRLDTMDLTRPQARIELDGARGRRLGGKVDGSAALTAMLHRAVAALAMEQVGGAQACLDMSVAYAKERHQFGRPIGSFQAIKHMCADMLVAVESAKSAAYHLAGVIDHDSDGVAVAAPLAKSYASEAYLECAADAIQIHGGIGFTWEHDAHLFLKRAKSSELLFGAPARHRARLADTLAF